MKLYILKKGYNRENIEIQRAVMSSMELLLERITEYEKQGVCFGND